MKRLSLALATVMVFAMVTGASAQVLWDQSDLNVTGPGFFNSESGSPPMGSTMHTVTDVTAPGAWHMTSITVYFSALDPGFAAGIFQGYLHVWPKTGPTPVEDPTASSLINLSAVVVPGPGIDPIIEVSTVGLDMNIAAGDYWIGITPIAPAPFGPEIHQSSLSAYGDASPTYDPFGFPMPMWGVWVPGVDAAILIEGSGPVPNESRSVSSVKAQFDN